MRFFVGVIAFLLVSVSNAESVDKPWTEVVHEADTDGDGRISVDEVKEYAHAKENIGFQAFMADHFIELDTDNDAMVGQDEFRAGLLRLGIGEEEISKGFVHGFAFMSRD